MTDADLKKEIMALRDLMISVATGGPRIQSVDNDYQEGRSRIASELRQRGITDPNPFQDLWAWYGRWSSGDLPNYQSRREFIGAMHRDVIAALESGSYRGASPRQIESTGWSRVDRGIEKVRQRLESAEAEEDFQGVGHLCRETLISLAQAVYDPALHPSLDDKVPSETDAKRMLEAFIAVELVGSSNEEARRHAKASLALADALTHRRTAQVRDATLCAEATTSTINIIAILSGRRERTSTAQGSEEPFKIPSLNDPVLLQVVEHFKQLGEEAVLPLLEKRDVKLAGGYRVAYYPETKREVWAGLSSGRYEHLLMLRPKK
jgi:hypothetical protein